MEFEFKVGWCPFCDQGWAEIVKDIAHHNLIIMCSECDTVWDSPQEFIKNRPNAGYQNTVVVTEPAIEEIISMNWDGFIDKT